MLKLVEGLVIGPDNHVVQHNAGQYYCVSKGLILDCTETERQVAENSPSRFQDTNRLLHFVAHRRRSKIEIGWAAPHHSTISPCFPEHRNNAIARCEARVGKKIFVPGKVVIGMVQGLSNPLDSHVASRCRISVMEEGETFSIIDDTKDIEAVSLLTTVKCSSICPRRSSREIDVKSIHYSNTIGNVVFGLKIELDVISSASIRPTDEMTPSAKKGYCTARSPIKYSTA